MKKQRFSVEQIAAALKQAELGLPGQQRLGRGSARVDGRAVCRHAHELRCIEAPLMRPRPGDEDRPVGQPGGIIAGGRGRQAAGIQAATGLGKRIRWIR
ncbi:hypothetical protein AXW74_12200 [Sphingobium sp. AM]|nr:hypothetical protein AXW74_12200 [Sphingobium sp. AM]OAP31104.1 hypothetical protein A8O16_14695 [Sphingobium sp. 20006FA]